MIRRSLLSLLIVAGCCSAFADSESEMLSSAMNLLSKVSSESDKVTGGGASGAAPQAATAPQAAPQPVPQFESSPETPVTVAAVPLRVCSSPDELGKSVRNALEPYRFPENVQMWFAQGKPGAVIAEENGQLYLYFLGRIDDFDKIPAAELDSAIQYHAFSALLPQNARHVTFYQRGSRMLTQSRGVNESHTIAWYLNNEKKYTVTSSRGNHYSWNSVSNDALDKVDSFSFECFNVNRTENLAVFLLKGRTKSFLFLGRTPVGKNFVAANNFFVVK